jgi:CRP/FNR family transcriptional regulator, cyclic AMP receptor protein
LNVANLIDAIAAHTGEDALHTGFGPQDWEKAARFFSVVYLQVGRELMAEGQNDRDLYIIEAGTVDVQIRGNFVATLTPGTVVGEGTFFSGTSRSATVVCREPGVAWCLSEANFDAMAKKEPRLALALMRGLGGVLAQRMRAAVLVGQFT